MKGATVTYLDRSTGTGVPSVAPDCRVYAIGDIHGRFDLLMELLGKICSDADARRDHRRTRIVFLGDYIDRGENSREVLRTLTDIAAFGSDGIVFLRGNHEDALRAFLVSPTRGAAWLDYGGLQTLASLGIRPPQASLGKQDLFRVREELATAISAFEPLFDAMVNSHRCGDVVFTHAGVDPSRSLEDQSAATLLWGHAQARVDIPVPGLKVVHGHYDEREPVSRSGRICVDTGAYYSNRLTAVRLDDAECFLSTGGALE